jgi:hypothetical protein
MKKRRPTRRKQFRQPPKRLPPTSTPPLDWLMPLAQPTPIRGAPNPALGTSGIVQPPLPLREAAAAIQAEAAIQLEDATLRADATVGRAAQYKEMLSWIGVLEVLMAELPNQRRRTNDPPITGEDIPSITKAVAILKAQPVVPTAPDDAKAAGSTLMRFGERLGDYLDIFFKEAAKSGGKELGKQLARAPYWLALWYTLTHIVQSVAAWLP